jgi:hypothetical protein
MSPALAFGWQLWTRHRLGLSLCAGYWLLLVLGANALPAASLPHALLPLLVVAPCGAVFVYLVCVLSFSREARLEARESGFPPRLWTLPLPTWTLAGWPMLWGTIVLASAWLTLSCGVLWVSGMEPGLLIWWPALCLAVALAWLQALVWTPFPLPWLRAVVAAPLVGTAISVPQVVLSGFDIHEGIAAALLAVQLPAAYLLGVFGVARARRGHVPRWTWPGWRAWLVWSSATTVGRPFVAPTKAQLWFEWRRCGLSFPLALAGCSLIWLVAIPWIAEFIDLAARGGVPLVPPILLRELGSLWLAALGLLLLPALMACAYGLEVGRLPGRDRTQALSSFLASRPTSAAVLVRAKFEAAALSALAGWGILAVEFVLWLALAGHGAEMASQLDALRQRHPAALFWGSLAFLVLAGIGLTWLQIVERVWIGLAGRAWMMANASLGFAGFLGVVVFGAWLVKSPQHWPTFLALLPWLAGGAVVLKILAAAWSLGALKRRHLIPPAVLWGALGVWLVLAVGTFGVLYALLPDDWFSVPGVVLGIVLVMPLTRLALAPLALAWNRHR